MKESYFLKKYVLSVLTVFVLVASACSVSPEAENQINYSDPTALTDRTSHGSGALPEDPARYSGKMMPQSLLSQHFKAGAVLPSTFDFSSKMPPVQNQGGQNSCVGWAVGYYLKTYHEGLEELWNIQLTANEFSPSWVYNQINSGRDNGSLVSDAMDLIVKNGCDTLANFPYQATDYLRKPDAASVIRGEHYKAYEWYTLPMDVATIKGVIAGGNAVVFRFELFPDFDNLSTSNPVYDNASGTSRGGHAVCVVGYDDAKQAFKVVNSWGNTWGTWMSDADQTKGKGYGWVSYNFIATQNPIGLGAWVLVDWKNVKDSQIIVVPATIQTESYNNASGVIVEACSEGGQDLKLLADGSWAEYTINVTGPDDYYYISFRAASTSANAAVSVHYWGVDQVANPIGSTGGTQTWVTVKRLTYLHHGISKIRIKSVGSVSLNWIKLEYVNPPASSSSSSSSVASNPNVKVLFFSGSIKQYDNQMYPGFRLYNYSTVPVSLASLKIRYYYTIDGEKAQNFWCDYTPINATDVTGTFVKMSQPKTGADYYLEVGFKSTAGNLAPGAEIQVRTRVAKSDWSNYNQFNDFSFDPVDQTYAEWDHIAVYQSGTLIQGVVP